MLKIFGTPNGRDCDGFTRRNFLQVGSLSAAGLSLPNLLAAKDQAAQEGLQIKNKSVIWIWLAGGPTHVETFDPKMTAPIEYRSITGECKTPISGVTVGGTFPEIAKCVDRMALVRSFAHGSSSHGTGTTWVMTGYNDRDNMKPSLGSIISRAKGSEHERCAKVRLPHHLHAPVEEDVPPNIVIRNPCAALHPRQRLAGAQAAAGNKKQLAGYIAW